MYLFVELVRLQYALPQSSFAHHSLSYVANIACLAKLLAMRFPIGNGKIPMREIL